MTDGFIILNKGEGMTSQTAVTRVRRLFSAEKAGHTGTLDPMATGVLPVLLNRGVKASEFMLSADKHYRATLRLGITTDTEDTTGTVLSASDRVPTEAEVAAAIDSMVGTSRQTPPMYSALKVGGKKLCDLARAGITVARESREITVFSIGREPISPLLWQLDVHCSKGTYIRTLCADIGAKLGTGGVMASLCRTEACGYSLADAHTLDEIEAMSGEERAALIHPVEEIFRDLPRAELPPFFARLARAGQPVALRKLPAELRASLGENVTRVRICDADGFFALGEVSLGTIPGTAAPEPVLRSIRLFSLR